MSRENPKNSAEALAFSLLDDVNLLRVSAGLDDSTSCAFFLKKIKIAIQDYESSTNLEVTRRTPIETRVSMY